MQLRNWQLKQLNLASASDCWAVMYSFANSASVGLGEDHSKRSKQFPYLLLHSIDEIHKNSAPLVETTQANPLSLTHQSPSSPKAERAHGQK